MMGWESDVGHVAGPNIATDMESVARAKYGRPSEEGDTIRYDGRVFHKTKSELRPGVMGVDMAVEDSPLVLSKEEFDDSEKAVQKEQDEKEELRNNAALVLSGLARRSPEGRVIESDVVDACNYSKGLMLELKKRKWFP